MSGPCAQLLSGSHRRFRVRNLLCDAPRFSETAAPLGSHRRFRVRNLLCGASRFSETAVPLGSHRRFPGGNPLCGPPGFPADQKGGSFPPTFLLVDSLCFSSLCFASLLEDPDRVCRLGLRLIAFPRGVRTRRKHNTQIKKTNTKQQNTVIYVL